MADDIRAHFDGKAGAGECEVTTLEESTGFGCRWTTQDKSRTVELRYMHMNELIIGHADVTVSAPASSR